MSEAGAAEGAGKIVSPEEAAAIEQAISACVRSFYGKAREDDLLGPVFAAAVSNWEHHFKRIDDFWSHVLLGTNRYSGHPYPLHAQLAVGPQHFDRWLLLFEQTVIETLAPAQAKIAIAKARMMARSFQAGMFPFKDEYGRPKRAPAGGFSADK